MRDKILQFARGDFSGSRSKLVLSENRIILEASEGRKTKGSLYIGNDNGTNMKGLIISDCRYLTLSDRQFSGKEATIDYVFNAEELQAGETISTGLVIISSCGEVTVPVDISVGIPYVQYSEGKINDLTEFAAVADAYPEEALDIFLSDDFKKIFLYRDIEKQALYDALIRCPDKMYALDEFLIAARKRNRAYSIMPEAEAAAADMTASEAAVNPYDSVIEEYIDFMCGLISAEEFTYDMDRLFLEYRNVYSELRISMGQAYAALVTGKNDIAKGYARECLNIDKPAPGAPLEDIIEYSFARYLCAIVSAPEEMTQNAAWAAKEIRYYYENGYDHYVLLWFLINIDSRYHNNVRAAFTDMLGHIKKDCTSPLIYYEFCRAIRKDPDLMHEWDDAMIRPLEWGVEKGLFDESMALVYTFHVSRIREYDEAVFDSLAALYDRYELEDTLQAICSILIRYQMISEKYLKWFELGIKKQLPITKIYEAYMQSLPDDAVRIIPHRIMLYFMYDNNLADREKELLYASAIRDKDNNPSIYKAYSVMIANFARKQLEEGKINDALAIIYEDTIKLSTVDETIAACLPEVMFTYRIECTNPEMTGVCVVHKELKDEQYAEFENGQAYVDLYSGNAMIMLVDAEGNRYTGPEYYTLKKMLRLDAYAEKCFEVSYENPKLVAYMFIKMINDLHAGISDAQIRRCARTKLFLSDYYSGKNTKALIRYYYEHAEGDYLDSILNEVDEYFDRSCINYFIARAMYEKAFRAVKYFGTKGIEDQYMVRLFDEYAEKFGPDTYDDTLLSLAYAVFDAGNYTDSIIRYLAVHFIGSSEQMFEIYKAAKGFNINKDGIEERLLTQLLFTENDVHRGMPLLESYLGREDNDRDLKKGYIGYLSYRYIADDEEMTDTLWRWLKDIYLTEYNVVCILAMIKKYSMKEELNEEEKVFCESRIEKMAAKGIILPFYSRFSGYRSRRYILCVSAPGQNISIRYKVNDDAIYTAPMNEVYYGMYVRELVVFMDEELTYELIEEKSGRKTLLGQGKLEYVEDVPGEISRYKMINRMIKYYDDRDTDSLYSCMETYVKLEEASHSLFEIL